MSTLNVFSSLKTKSLILSLIIFSLLFCQIQTVTAHEVYVLEADEIESILQTKSPNPFTAIADNSMEFFTWAFISAMVVLIVFFVSIIRPIEQKLDPILFKIKRKFGFFVVRLTIGLAIFASGYYHALFGPELPLGTIFGVYENIISVIFMLIGLGITLGILTRYLATFAFVLILPGIYHYNWYLLTYSNYIGEIIFVGLLGAHVWSLDKHILHWHGLMGRIERFFEHYSFLLLRITYGFSLIFASVYAKIIHSELALRTVTDYNLTAYFHFEPLFIVVGAALIEITIGLFIMIGFEVRFASLFLLFFLTLSLLYFGEAVWPHIVLFGGALALFIHGYDRYTLEGHFFKDAQHEPVL